ncbi:hypothetical protein D0T25_24980 [Duganella sp. BJB488]|uniref:glycosyltransferase n=1 Tax=unclassified Duganella TaxID=2636909 RepID=UPI000E355047|nr:MULTISPECIES: glycosyltransferase [unclassified Duganella]NVD73936.1 glycosyltransferase [Duganella sp. BJB1802]RFP12387.1 hypothetical protein D0T26_24175 [Duganella sp. BJB489]RFP16519.1 hypothetical protein D0T25_24980 [Duganella sp. BJB488]RFP30751.1 hypothetical protein D0T24_25520 [Duganella sp. BJB480]
MKREHCHLLLCGPFPEPVGGVSIHLRRLLAALAAQPRYTVRCVDEAGRRKPGLFNLRSLNAWAYLRLLWWADLVHVHSSVTLFRLLHVLCARLLGKPVIVTLHSHRPRHRLEHGLTRLCCALAQAVVAVNGVIRDAVCPAALVIPAYIAPGADEEWVPAALQDWIDRQRGQGRLLLVSNAYKLARFDGADLYGLDTLLEVFERAPVRRRYALLFVVASVDGCEAAYAGYQRRIVERGLQEQVLLVHQPMPFAGLLKRCDVSVRATNTDGDALSVRESLSYGKRTLASDCVARPAGAELFATRDADALAALLQAPARHGAADVDSFDLSLVNLYGTLS